MKPDTKNVVLTFLMIGASLGLGRTGFVWNERLNEQSARITELQNQVIEAVQANSALAQQLEVHQRQLEIPKQVSVAPVLRTPVTSPTPSPISEADLAVLQAVANQIQVTQNQINNTKTPTKTVNNTPQQRSRTTRAS